MIFTSPFSSLFKSHLFQHLRNFKNHRFLEVLIFTFPLIHSHPLWISLLRFRVFPLIVGEFSWFGVNVPRSISKPDFQKRPLFKFESFLNSQVFHSFLFVLPVFAKHGNAWFSNVFERNSENVCFKNIAFLEIIRNHWKYKCFCSKNH